MAKILNYTLTYECTVYKHGKLPDQEAIDIAIEGEDGAVDVDGGTPESWGVDEVEAIDIGRVRVKLIRKV